MCSLTGKTLEAALGILNIRQDQQTNQPVEHAPHQVASDRFTIAYCSRRLARAYRHTTALPHSHQKAGEFLKRHRKISITHEDQGALRSQKSLLDCLAFASMR